MICSGCRGDTCASDINEKQPAEIECPICSGRGCNHCHDGVFLLTECGQKFVPSSLKRAINYAGHAMQGVFPVNGGLLDQSAWFVDLWSTLESEQNKIDAERWKRMKE